MRIRRAGFLKWCSDVSGVLKLRPDRLKLWIDWRGLLKLRSELPRVPKRRSRRTSTAKTTKLWPALLKLRNGRPGLLKQRSGRTGALFLSQSEIVARDNYWRGKCRMRLQRRILERYAIRSPRQFPYARRIQCCHKKDTVSS